MLMQLTPQTEGGTVQGGLGWMQGGLGQDTGWAGTGHRVGWDRTAFCYISSLGFASLETQVQTVSKPISVGSYNPNTATK